MKTELNIFLNDSNCKEFIINSLFWLERVTRDQFGNKVDKIVLHTNSINDTNYAIPPITLLERDTEGLTWECIECMQSANKLISERMVDNFGHGRREGF